ncbi:MAG: hypothetical protein H6709_12350 [Kofleriaceae bacterium]|nr:hypothetical protein [Kofleriaceae bacterium]MCB9572869.1 hypothetical protein [Kofleriaceae bacterium]
MQLTRRVPTALALALALATAAGCGRSGGGAAGVPPPPYALSCDSADTAQQSTLFCVRTDTRNGDVMVVDLDRLPITSGASRAADEPAGTYQTICDSTVTPTKSDFRCLRMHVRTGEIVVLRLAELPHWPR